MAANSEILVHVGAPSAASDDARYRALVDSCLAFGPISRQSVFCLQDHNDGSDLKVSVDKSRSFVSLSSSSSGQPSFSAHHHETVSINSGDDLDSLVTSDQLKKLEPAQHIEARLEPHRNTAQLVSSLPESTEESDISFRPLIPLTSQIGAGNTPNSPEYLESPFGSVRGLNADQIHDGQSTWETPLEVIPDSQQDEEADQTTVDDSIQVDRSFVPDSARQSRKFALDSTEDDPDNDITRIPSSVPSPSPRESFTNSQTHMASRGISDLPLIERSTNLQPLQANTSVSASVLGKRKVVTNESSSQESHNGELKAHASSKSRPIKRPTLPQAPRTISLDNLPIEIRTPDPPVSNDKFCTHITPTLKALAERMKQSSRFTPRSQNRELHPLERGYWFLPCIAIVADTSKNEASSIDTNTQVWTQTFFSQFWCFIRDFFTEGRAGWGIWCLLEHNSSASSTNGKSKIVNLKLYTWGEVAPHLYLLLFLATERRIKKMKGVVWRDAKDESVIIM